MLLPTLALGLRSSRMLMCESGAAAVLSRCALDRDAPAAEVLATLEQLDRGAGLSRPVISAADLQGHRWELIFSSAAAKLPLLDGYMPNREVLTWDLERSRLELEIETLPLLPKIRVVGEDLAWDEPAQTLTYSVKQKPPSFWRILFFDAAAGVLAAKSSVTGLNVIRRLRGGAATAVGAGAAGASLAGLVPAFLTRVEQVNDCSKAPPLVPLLIDGEQLGTVSPRILAALAAYPDVFDTTSSAEAVTLAPRLASAPLDARSAAVHEVAVALSEAGVITKWRDETLALVTRFDAPPALQVERRLVPLLGGRGYGVAVNGYSRHPQTGEAHIWVATRAADKATWPGLLDALSAGAMAAGDSPTLAARSEAAEEAGVPAEMLEASLRPAGAVSYRGVDEDPELPKDDVFFLFDLELPWSFEPVAVDGEVQRFERMPVAEAARCVAYGAAPGVFECLHAGTEAEEAGSGGGGAQGAARPNAFKPNINLVVLDFLVRHGHISADAPGYLELVGRLRQAQCN